MATKYWQPKATAVAQVSTVQVTAFDATTTYTLTVGGVEIVSVLGTTDANGTASAISTAWNNSTHIYATGVTASVATDTVTLTADTAEVPFTATSAATGGTGTIGAVTESTAPTGPQTLDEPLNWSGETLPANSDVLVFRDSDDHVAWGLAGLSTTGHTLRIEQSYTGRIGLNRAGYATSADGQTVDSTAPEYRDVYLQLDIARPEFGDHQGLGDPGGSGRLMINNIRNGASQAVVYRTARNGTETGKPPLRYLAAHASAHLDVRDGRVGVAVGVPGETATLGNIVAQGGVVIVGGGTTFTNYTQDGGANLVYATVATVTKALVHGGSLDFNGDQAVTTLEVTGGTVVSNITGTISTVTHRGGIVDYTRSGEARTVTTHQLFRGATLRTDDDIVTITNLLEPDGPSVITVS